MFGLFGNKKKQKQSVKEFDEELKNVLSGLHPRINSVYDNDVLESITRNNDIMIPVMLLIIMSSLENISDRLDLYEEELARTIEVNRANG